VKYGKTDYYPKFEIAGRNYAWTDEGDIAFIKGGLPPEEVQDLLTRSRDLQKEYAEKRIVGEKDVAAILGIPGTERPALPPGQVDDEFVDAEDDIDM
jgi:hypothetical protein